MRIAGDNPLYILVNKELASITFIRDYYQFHFEGPGEFPVLTVITDPKVVTKADSFERNSPNFCNVLLNCISRKVVETSLIEGKAAKIMFNNDILIYISLLPEDYRGAEAIRLVLDKHWWVW